MASVTNLKISDLEERIEHVPGGPSYGELGSRRVQHFLLFNVCDLPLALAIDPRPGAPMQAESSLNLWFLTAIVVVVMVMMVLRVRVSAKNAS